MDQLTQQIEKEARKHFDKKGGHDFHHTQRVYRYALQIARTEKKVDLQIIRAATLLHDIARRKQEQKKCKDHAEEGAKMAPQILKKVNFPKNKIQAVVHCISVHRKSKGKKPTTIEAKILQDADKIDILGAMGILRTAVEHADDMIIHSDGSRVLTSFYDYNTDSIFEFLKCMLLLDLKDFYTKEARKIAKSYLNFLKIFIKQFEKEWR
ncbi:HD domain-containing protein [Nanoarchaeota archaeon]